VLLVVAALALVSLLFGVHEQTAPVAFIALTGPLAFWCYAMGLLLVVEKFPQFGWVLVALGALPLSLLIASFGVRIEAPSVPRAPAQTTVKT
jgi:hypothetical protein